GFCLINLSLYHLEFWIVILNLLILSDIMNYTIRIVYSKEGKFILFGHLDTIDLILKAVRRADLDFVTGQGYKRKIKYSAAPALSLGFSSDCEFIDFYCEKNANKNRIFGELSKQFPAGLDIKEVIVTELKLRQPIGCVYEKEGKTITVRFGAGVRVSPPGRRISFIF
ncbi:MAG: DUF2344 domain-containing protein, partial [Elusimicrobia bacterium]|nr:DUF2344 domain-containing protein [Elusimicrobiota bacterium]